MGNSQFVRIVDGADTAVLCIHGIVGTPYHFRDFVSLVPEHISVYNMLLDGHGGTALDFSHTSMKKWEAQVGAVVQQLMGSHEKLYIVAHSLGTLLAIEQAVRNDRIAGLFLLAVPIKLFLKPRMVSCSAKVFFDRIRPDDLPAITAKNGYGIEKDRNLFHYFGWIPRFLELFAKIRATRVILPQLKVPCTAYQSVKDELVSVGSVSFLKKNSGMEVQVLNRSMHYYYEKEDYDYLLKEFVTFIGL